MFNCMVPVLLYDVVTLISKVAIVLLPFRDGKRVEIESLLLRFKSVLHI